MEHKHGVLSKTGLIIGVVLAALLGFTMYYLVRQFGVVANLAIADEVAALHKVLSEIDATCQITAIAHDRNYLDFFSIKQFVGSQVGPLSLRHPEKWKGPYFTQNFEVQGKVYELLKAKHGYAIVPGAGVKLPNGKVMGKDIVVDETVDLDTLLNDAGGLEFRGKQLAQKFELGYERINLPDAVDTTADL